MQHGEHLVGDHLSFPCCDDGVSLWVGSSRLRISFKCLRNLIHHGQQRYDHESTDCSEQLYWSFQCALSWRVMLGHWDLWLCWQLCSFLWSY